MFAGVPGCAADIRRNLSEIRDELGALGHGDLMPLLRPLCGFLFVCHLASSLFGMTLPDRLQGADLKLRRAKTHLDVIESKARALNKGPQKIPGERHPDVEARVFLAQHDSPEPTILSAEIGEFLYNVRCALDYIVYELLTLAGERVTTRHAFPIFTSADRYAREAPPKIAGVPSETVATFERLQPFYGPNSNPFHPAWRDPESEPLAVLRRLNDEDKHRTLALSEAIGAFRLEFPDDPDVLTAPTPMFVSPGTFKRGAILGTVTSLDPDVKVNLIATFHVSLKDARPRPGEHLVQTLDQILRVVRDRVVPSFAPYL
jgi:hypothetical protein